MVGAGAGTQEPQLYFGLYMYEQVLKTNPSQPTVKAGFVGLTHYTLKTPISHALPRN